MSFDMLNFNVVESLKDIPVLCLAFSSLTNNSSMYKILFFGGGRWVRLGDIIWRDDVKDTVIKRKFKKRFYFATYIRVVFISVPI